MSAKSTVLLVEDNQQVRETVAESLSEDGYAVITASSIAELNEKLPALKPDVILLDLILPDGDGLSLIKKIRDHTDAPVIVVSGKNDMVDKIVDLEMGADDYVGKPLQMKELAARIKAQLRRYKSMKSPSTKTATPPVKRSEAARIRFGGWTLDRPQFQVYDADGQTGNLTVKEFRLLEALAMEPNRVLSREQLLDRVSAGDYNVTDRAIDVHILRIRKKINDKPGPEEIIKAVRGIGYMMVSETEIL